MVDLDSLNPQQRQAVTTHRGPVLILAGAGTGKTRVITCRIAQMIRQGVPPEHILAVTFTNKAAREMKARVARMLPRRQAAHDGARPAGPTLCTFHALGLRILRRHIERLGYKTNFVIYDESEQLNLMRRLLAEISQRGANVDPYEALQCLSRFKNGQRDHPSLQSSAARHMAEHLLARYATALRACNAVDFDDLILLPLHLLDHEPEVLAACRNQYRYVMVDEYQDTNQAQFSLLRRLCDDHRNLCVVGDDDQSIYGWRGAEIANLLNLESHFPELTVVTLEQNYRSTNTILEAANAVIRRNPRRRGKRLWSELGAGERIALCECQTDEEEARAVAESIEFARLSRGIPWSDQAVLFRTNLQSRPVEIAFRQANIRYRLIGGQSFFDRREVRDLMAYLKVLLNPHDDVSLLRIANVPARGLSDVTMERLLAASQARQCSVYAAMRHTDVLDSFAARSRDALRRFAAFLESTAAQLAERPNERLAPWAEAFLLRIGYEAELRRLEKDKETAENRIRNLRELVLAMDRPSAVAEASATAATRLLVFLEVLTLDREREENDDQPGDLVTLITMHSCKGLEFPHVTILGLEDGLLPHERSKIENTLDEERRLFYVAKTRAMRSLTISYCLGRKKYGQLVPCHPSPFLADLPASLLERADEKAKTPVQVDAGRRLFSAIRGALN